MVNWSRQLAPCKAPPRRSLPDFQQPPFTLSPFRPNYAQRPQRLEPTPPLKALPAAGSDTPRARRRSCAAPPALICTPVHNSTRVNRPGLPNVQRLRAAALGAAAPTANGSGGGGGSPSRPAAAAGWTTTLGSGSSMSRSARTASRATLWRTTPAATSCAGCSSGAVRSVVSGTSCTESLNRSGCRHAVGRQLTPDQADPTQTCRTAGWWWRRT